MHRCRSSITVITFATAIGLSGCSHEKPISRDELRSHFTSAISFAAEAEMFIDYVRSKKPTHNFAAGHITYLQEEVSRDVEELTQKKPESGIDNDLEKCRKLMEDLRGEISGIRQVLDGIELLDVAKQRIAAIRQNLNAAKFNL